MIEGSRIESGAEKPKQSLEQFLLESLKGLFGEVNAEWQEDLRKEPATAELHAWGRLREKDTRKAGEEQFTYRIFKKFPPKGQVTDLVKAFYAEQGYSLRKEKINETGPSDLVFKHPNEEKQINVIVTIWAEVNGPGADIIVTATAI